MTDATSKTRTPSRRQLRLYSDRQLDQIPQIEQLSGEDRFAMRVVSSVLPFRVNQYVLEELIDWSQAPDDPIFQLTFPQAGMLEDRHFERVANCLRTDPQPEELRAVADEVRMELNPHPAGQLEHNVPLFQGRRLDGVQHKYPETVLFFPTQGQTCHSYCSFCFRWAQFVGLEQLRFAGRELERLHAYLASHPKVSDVLVTGGDPLVMKTRQLERILEPLLAPAYDHVQTIRLGTKSLTFWPHRFVYDKDADELLRLFERLVRAGKHVAVMAHFDHWRELETDVCREAVRRLRATGVVIRSQAPLLAHINDSPAVWQRLWRTQVRLGIVPYYMFVERDTGAKAYFEVPLARAVEIYNRAMRGLSGLARTARGPSMSSGPGKVEVQGVVDVAGERVFALRFVQARDPRWVGRPFFARYDAEATWFGDLRPAFGEQQFFFEPQYDEMMRSQEPHVSLVGDGA